MNAQLIGEGRSPVWCRLRVWAADLRDGKAAAREDAGTLVSILDAYDRLRHRPLLGRELWANALRLAVVLSRRYDTPLPDLQIKPPKAA